MRKSIDWKVAIAVCVVIAVGIGLLAMKLTAAPEAAGSKLEAPANAKTVQIPAGKTATPINEAAN